MIEIFIRGGPIMWPLLAVSIVTVAVLIERFVAIFRQRRARSAEDVKQLLESASKREFESVELLFSTSSDPIARVLAFGNRDRHKSFESAIELRAAHDLGDYARGLSVLDTVVTLSPLLGLLGAVTGMIRSFQVMGTQELGAPKVLDLTRKAGKSEVAIETEAIGEDQ